MKKLSIVLFAITAIALSGCESVRPYAATINGQRITDQDVLSLSRAASAFSSEPESPIKQSPSIVSNAQAGSFLMQLMEQRAKHEVLLRHGVNSETRAEQKFNQLLNSSVNLSETARKAYGSLRAADKSIAARVYTSRFVFGALDAGVKPTDSSDIVCADVAQVADVAAANEVVKKVKAGSPLSSLSVTIETCYAVSVPDSDPLGQAVRAAKAGDILGPINEGQDQFGQATILVASVSRRDKLAFINWPLTALSNVQSSGNGPLSEEFSARTKVKVNPVYGRLPTTSLERAQCGNNPICIVPPVDPTADQRQTEQSPFG